MKHKCRGSKLRNQWIRQLQNLSRRCKRIHPCWWMPKGFKMPRPLSLARTSKKSPEVRVLTSSHQKRRRSREPNQKIHCSCQDTIGIVNWAWWRLSSEAFCVDLSDHQPRFKWPLLPSQTTFEWGWLLIFNFMIYIYQNTYGDSWILHLLNLTSFQQILSILIEHKSY